MKRKEWKIKNFYVKKEDFYILEEIKKRHIELSPLIINLLKKYLEN